MKKILILLLGLYAGTALFAQKNDKTNAAQDKLDTKYTEGASGVKRSISYKFSSSSEAADPGNGTFRYDAGNISKAGYIYLDDIDLSGEDQTKWYKTWDDTTGATGRGQLNIVEKDGKNVNVFYVTGVFTDAGGYWKIPVEYVSGSMPADGSAYFYIFNRIARKNDKNTAEKKEEVVKPAEQVAEVIPEVKEEVKPAEQIIAVVEEKKEDVKPAEIIAEVKQEVKEEIKPVIEVKQEVKEEIKPVVEVKQEVKEEVKPAEIVAEVKQEVKEEIKPVIEVKQEVKEEIKPVVEVKQEVKEEIKPVTEVKQEVKEDIKPVVEVKQEVKEEIKPVIEVKQEVKEEIKPVVEVKQEVKEEVKPVIEVKQEVKEEVKPVIEVKQEVKEEVKPVIEVKQEVKEDIKPIQQVAENKEVVPAVNQEVAFNRTDRRTGATNGGRENRVQDTGRQTTQTSQRVGPAQNTQVTSTTQTNQAATTQTNKVTTTQKTQPDATQNKQTATTQTTSQKQTVSNSTVNQNVQNNQVSQTQKSGPTFTSSTINYNTGTNQANTQVSNTTQNRQTETQAQRYQYNQTSQVQKTGRDEQVTLPARKEVVSDQSYSGSLGSQGYQTVSTSTGEQSSFSGRGRGWWRGIIEAGYGFGIGEYGMNNFRINFINAVRIGDFSSIGLGIGYRRFFDKPGDHPLWYSLSGKSQLPVFLDLRTNFSTRKVTPYLALGIGNSLRLGSSETVNEGMYICPSGGIWFNISRRLAFFGGVAYEIQKLEFAAYSDDIPFKKNSNSISLNLGISF